MTKLTDKPEDRLAKLMAVTERDAAPPDRVALAALRERAATEFAAAGQEPELTHQQRATMFLTRALIALAATAAAVLGAVLLRDRPRPVANVTLGTVVKNFALFHDLHGTLTADGTTRHVFRGDDDELRIDTAPGRYEISRGEQSWTLNEADNRAVPSTSPYYSPELAAIDPLRLLDFDATAFRDVKPIEKRRVNGRDQYVFYCSQPMKGGTRELAVVTDETNYYQLMSLQSRQVIGGVVTPLAEYKPFASTVQSL